MLTLLTTRQAANELGVTPARIIALITAGRLKAEKIGMQWLVQRADLAAVRHRKPGRPRKKRN
jgi:excisionase family DNA binding protein